MCRLWMASCLHHIVLEIQSSCSFFAGIKGDIEQIVKASDFPLCVFLSSSLSLSYTHILTSCFMSAMSFVDKDVLKFWSEMTP